MDILVHSEGFTLTDAQRSLVEGKITHCETYAPRALRARVTIRRTSAHASQTQFEASVLIEVPGSDVAAEQKASTPIEAVDLLLEKIERRLEKRKDENLSKRTKLVRPKEAIIAD